MHVRGSSFIPCRTRRAASRPPSSCIVRPLPTRSLPPLRMAHVVASSAANQIRYLTAKEALDVDVELMGDVIKYPTEVLMELAGLR